MLRSWRSLLKEHKLSGGRADTRCILRFGYYILNTYVPEFDGASPELYAHWFEQIDAAEDLGFDSLWVTEHHFRRMMPNPQLLLTAAAQRTKRMLSAARCL